MYLRFLTIIIILSINGCSTSPKTEQLQVQEIIIPKPPILFNAFESGLVAIESNQEVFTLTPKQQKHFLKVVLG